MRISLAGYCYAVATIAYSFASLLSDFFVGIAFRRDSQRLAVRSNKPPAPLLVASLELAFVDFKHGFRLWSPLARSGLQ